METPLPPVPPMEQPARENNRIALAAGVCGIGSFVVQALGWALVSGNQSVSSLCSGVAGFAWLAGIVLGIVGLVQIRRHPGQKGKGWAITGIGLGFLRICIVVVSILLLAVPSVGINSTTIGK